AQVSGDPLPSAEPSAETAKPLPLAVVLQVEPGERTHVGRVRVVIQGPLADAGGAADAVDATAASTGRDRSAAELSRQLQQDWKLGVGSAYGQSAWTDAKDALLLAARTEGYALASLSGSAAEVDTATNRADLYVVLDSGPLFRFGEVRFEGLEHVDESTMRAMQTFTPGMTLREKQLLDYQERLVKSSLFDTVAVQYEPDVALAGAMPITVRVTEHALQQATFGVGVSDITGPRITIEHLHQRPLDFSWQARTRLQLGRNAQSLQLDLTSHPRPGGPFRNLFSAAVSQTDASGLRVTSQRVRLGRSQETDNLERTVFVEVQRAATRDLTTQVNTDDTTAATLNYNWLLRALDDTILPTEGYAFSAETGVGRSFATAAGANTNDLSGYFARGLARLTGYLPLGQSWYGQARLQVGQVVARERIAVPFTLLFRAGGDESVRGYGYQTLGPANRDGSAAGGRVLGTASVEIARPISRNLPAWWWAAFYDLGNAATGWNTYRIDQGYGLGLRWRSPVGPLRIDLAYGAAVRHLRLHFNVGLTF
ncbi:MAG: autotransporter assembly complex family protein, partial [Leptothrix sp. (in: b-proteobacteria)]